MTKISSSIPRYETSTCLHVHHHSHLLLLFIKSPAPGITTIPNSQWKKIHIAHSPPQKTFSFTDLLLTPTPTSTPIAGTTPFPLLSPEGVRCYRKALFQRAVIANCANSPGPGALILRGPSRYSTFIKDLWTHPETMQIVSETIGVPLEIVMPLEIGHTNIQTRSDSVDVKAMVDELGPEPLNEPVELSDADREYDPLKVDSIIPWHYDSYPYVCVLMLSHTEGMVGGETYIKRGDGSTAKIEGPQLGYACMLQGGEVQHLAARAIGVKERITTITSYRAATVGTYDSSYIANVRPYTSRSALYSDWTLYRLAKMREEISALEKTIVARPDQRIDVGELEAFVASQTAYLKRTARQLIPEEQEELLLAKYGMRSFRTAAKIWESIFKTIPIARQLTPVAGRDCWMPSSPLWRDLRDSLEDIQAGRMLESQKGRFVWTNERAYCMGDELLRQGLNEFFLSWLDAVGLWSLYRQLIPAEP
ncbi:hypothetical protein K402DRAFT_339024 [Aulographum hederae CBS 113979]|uniref:Fe2OG dioxygenase domain-containing protein n=1 Tax=Aulographum hederae CBS 113979 TaxID=1176131 RepID=A0A6G1GQP9_9PEZI|nr:hypothetical protein K402DRAFT_339024 [Aulographum hederae CBS 113979]